MLKIVFQIWISETRTSNLEPHILYLETLL